jgi:hypothetical protein
VIGLCRACAQNAFGGRILITTHHDGAAESVEMLFDGVKVFAKLLTGTDVNDFARDVEQFVNDQANLQNSKILEGKIGHERGKFCTSKLPIQSREPLKAAGLSSMSTSMA